MFKIRSLITEVSLFNRCRLTNTVNKLRLLAAMTFLLFSYKSQGQSYAVQATTQLAPPYSVYLSDYATPGEEKLRVILVQRDITQPAYQLRLMMMVELDGRVILQTSRAFNPRPITLDPGVPTVISGTELAAYLDSRNIDFVGYSREQYERTKALPEGSYRICFVAYDYRRQDRQVSNEGCSFYYLSKNEPPITNIPVCGIKVPVRTPQFVTFSWLPRNTASANSAGNTHYEFALYETRPKGRNPNDVVLTTQPVFKITTEATQFVYGASEPMLLDSMTYVWRVRAVDKNGKDAFRNNGYSEVCTFRYGGFDPQFDIGIVKNLRAEAQNERRGRVWWDTGEYQGYRIYYRKAGNKDYEWFSSDLSATGIAAGTNVGEIKLYDLEPDTEYETRVQARKNNAYGPFSETIKFRTLPLRVAQCGEVPPLLTEAPGNPLAFATSGMIIKARSMEMTLVEVGHLAEDGFYKGVGFVNPKYFGGARFYVKFDRLFIDENRVAAQNGRIDFVTEEVAKWQKEQIAQQQDNKLEKQQKENRQEWADTEFYDKIVKYDEVVIDNVTLDASGNIVITDVSGGSYINTEIPVIMTNAPEKAIIIEDKNGEQYVVQKDKTTGQTKVTKVEGGGLTPGGNAPVASDVLIVIRRAMRLLASEYNDTKISTDQSSMRQKENDLASFVNSENEKVISTKASASKTQFFGEFVEEPSNGTKDGTEDQTFKNKSSSYKNAERLYYKTVIARLFAQENRSSDELTVIAQGLSVEGKPVADYVSAEKKNGKTNNDIAPKVKDAVVQLIEKILNDYVYDVK